MSNDDLEEKNCSILENILYFLNSFDEPSYIYPNPNLSISEQIQHLKNILLQYYTENKLQHDLSHIQQNHCIFTRKRFTTPL